RGFTPALLYGEDANWNYQLDPNEDDAEVQFPPDNKDGKLDSGLRPYCTVCSFDLNRAKDGSRRLNLNDSNDALTNREATATEELPPALVEYVEAARRSKVQIEQPSDLLEAKTKFKNEAGQQMELESGIGKNELPLVLDRFTTTNAVQFAGLIN